MGLEFRVVVWIRFINLEVVDIQISSVDRDEK